MRSAPRLTESAYKTPTIVMGIFFYTCKLSVLKKDNEWQLFTHFSALIPLANAAAHQPDSVVKRLQVECRLNIDIQIVHFLTFYFKLFVTQILRMS